MNTLRTHQPNLSTGAALRLEFLADEDSELPLVLLTAATLRSIWDQTKASSEYNLALQGLHLRPM